MFLIFQLIIELNSTEFIVQFDSAGGNQVISKKVESGTKVRPPMVPKRSGYTFKGWYLNDTKFDFDEVITKSIRLEAKWEK